MENEKTWQTYAQGEFLSLKGERYSVTIDVYKEETISNPLDIVFPAKSPVTIEWKRTEKYDAVCSSITEVQVVSPEPQSYIGLYNIEAGSVRCIIRKNGEVYWSGYMDSEFYEEPFDSAENFIVKLSFTDFGILNRRKFDMEGAPTLREIINKALGETGVIYGRIDENISTYNINYAEPKVDKIVYINQSGVVKETFTLTKNCELLIHNDYTGGGYLYIEGPARYSSSYVQYGDTKVGENFPPGTYTLQHERPAIYAVSVKLTFTDPAGEEYLSGLLDNMAIQADNFYDEDDKPQTYYEVLTAILQPLALRIMYREGNIYIYDINAICNKEQREELGFSRTGQELGVDSVYNNIKITFSPYSRKEIFTGELNIEDADYYAEGELLNYTYNYPLPKIDRWEGLTMWYDFPERCLGKDIVPLTILPIIAKLKGKQENDGLILVGEFWRKNSSNSFTKLYEHRSSQAGASDYVRIYDNYRPSFEDYFKTKKRWVPYFPDMTSLPGMNDYILELEYSSLFMIAGIPEARETSQQYYPKFDTSYHDFTSPWWMMFCKVTLHGIDGKTYNLNQDDYNFLAHGNGSPVTYKWLEETYNRDVICLNLTDKWNSRKEDWRKYTINIPLPPCAGHIEIEYSSNFGAYIPSSWTSPSNDVMEDTASQAICWWIVKPPKLTLYIDQPEPEEGEEKKKYAVELDDIETTGIANEKAEEELAISTVCGSSAHLSPISRGIYLLANSLVPMSDGWKGNKLYRYQNLHRGNLSATPEQLLIRTLMSQYSCRHLVLSGDTDILAGGINKYFCNQLVNPVPMMLVEDRQDLIEDLSNATFIEITPDEEPVEYKEKQRFIAAKPRSKRLQENNIALVKKDARISAD